MVHVPGCIYLCLGAYIVCGWAYSCCVCVCVRQESSTWVEKDLSLTSPADLHSSSGEEEDALPKRRQGYPSESSDDDDYIGMGERRVKPLIIEEKKTSNGSNDLGDAGRYLPTCTWAHDIPHVHVPV